MPELWQMGLASPRPRFPHLPHGPSDVVFKTDDVEKQLLLTAPLLPAGVVGTKAARATLSQPRRHRPCDGRGSSQAECYYSFSIMQCHQEGPGLWAAPWQPHYSSQLLSAFQTMLQRAGGALIKHPARRDHSSAALQNDLNFGLLI